MSTLTTVLGLTKPAGTETIGSWLTAHNGNMDLLDAAIDNRVAKGSPISNLITTTAVAGSVPLVAKGILNQTANLFEARDNVDVVKAHINSAGQFFSNGVQLANAASPLSLIANSAAERPLLLKGAASQSANLLEIQDSGGSVLNRVTSSGAGEFNRGLYTQGPINNVPSAGHFQIDNRQAAGTTDSLGMVIFARTAQTANMFEVRDGAGGLLNIIRANGQMAITPPGSSASSLLLLSGGATTAIKLEMRATASQTANVMEVQNSSGILLSGFRFDGTLLATNTTTTASSGATATLPAQARGYLVVVIDGTSRRIPYYDA